MQDQHLFGPAAFWRENPVLFGEATLEVSQGEKTEAEPAVRIGLFADLHYADRDPEKNRFYRDSQIKLQRCIDRFNELKPDFVVSLGDLIDAAETHEEERRSLRIIEAEFRRFSGPRHYVLGNHCLHAWTKSEFASETGAEKSFYSFDQGGFHFVVLDACFRGDGVEYERGNFDWTDSDIPHFEQKWLREDLSQTRLPTVVFVHQRLDVETDYAIKSASAVRRILEMSGRVIAVCQGHSHDNDWREIGGIHYFTLRAMVEGPDEENRAFALLELFSDRSIRLRGFGKQASYG